MSTLQEPRPKVLGDLQREEPTSAERRPHALTLVAQHMGFRLWILPLEGAKILIHAYPADKVANLMDKIWDQLFVPCDAQRLIWQGKHLDRGMYGLPWNHSSSYITKF
jgi:hypothetical protein